MDRIKVNHLVVGAGVVGLAIAKELSKIPKTTTFLIEKAQKFGMETSSRNSGVIHSGVYYPINSLKSNLCIRGRHLLYSFLEEYRIPHAKLGKFIVSMADQDLELEKFFQTGKLLDIPLNYISPQKISKLEPNLKARNALHSPETGILDSHSLMETLQNLILDQGGQVFYRTEAVRIEKGNSGFLVHLKDSTVIEADWVINCTGLDSNRLSSTLRPIKKPLYNVKGHYVKYNGPSLVSRLIYPMPDYNLISLGIHCTLDLSGSLIFGPDVQYLKESLDYSFPNGLEQEELLEKFYNSVSKYLKGVERDRLSVDYTGIRPKLSEENQGFQDFVIEKESEGFINLLGIESPGLTSCLAISEYVYDLIYK